MAQGRLPVTRRSASALCAMAPGRSNRWRWRKMICHECEGTGEVEYEYARRASVSIPQGFLDSYWDTCPECRGTGELDDDE